MKNNSLKIITIIGVVLLGVGSYFFYEYKTYIEPTGKLTPDEYTEQMVKQ